jgi:hypothetical protein
MPPPTFRVDTLLGLIPLNREGTTGIWIEWTAIPCEDDLSMACASRLRSKHDLVGISDNRLHGPPNGPTVEHLIVNPPNAFNFHPCLWLNCFAVAEVPCRGFERVERK